MGVSPWLVRVFFFFFLPSGGVSLVGLRRLDRGGSGGGFFSTCRVGGSLFRRQLPFVSAVQKNHR